MAYQSGISIAKDVVTKTSGCYTAENSLISAMALLCVIASTHFITVPDIQREIYREVGETSEGVRKLFDIITKFYNDSPIFVAHPELVLSTDDTVQYIFECKGVS